MQQTLFSHWFLKGSGKPWIGPADYFSGSPGKPCFPNGFQKFLDDHKFAENGNAVLLMFCKGFVLHYQLICFVEVSIVPLRIDQTAITAT